MVKILFLSPTKPNDVRQSKIAQYLHNNGFKLFFVGWCRENKDFVSDPLYEEVYTLQKGGGEGTKWLPLYYILYIIKVFFYLLFKKNLGDYIVYGINYEVSLAIYLASRIRRIKYIYDIYDELAISHNFPPTITSLIRSLDKKIRAASNFYIHVDENRLSDIDSDNYVIIYNSPIDARKKADDIKYENSLAVTGWLNKTRGLQSIYMFAKDNPQIRFIVAGKFIQKEYEQKFLSLGNVEYHDFMPQKDLFEIISTCRGIFSLYDPSIPINKLAASNKLYDAMMLSIPVVVNNDLLATRFVEENKIGYVVNYDYDESWNALSEFNCETTTDYGRKGRKIYVEKFEFNSMLDRVLLPKLKSIGAD